MSPPAHPPPGYHFLRFAVFSVGVSICLAYFISTGCQKDVECVHRETLENNRASQREEEGRMEGGVKEMKEEEGGKRKESHREEARKEEKDGKGERQEMREEKRQKSGRGGGRLEKS